MAQVYEDFGLDPNPDVPDEDFDLNEETFGQVGPLTEDWDTSAGKLADLHNDFMAAHSDMPDPPVPRDQGAGFTTVPTASRPAAGDGFTSLPPAQDLVSFHSLLADDNESAPRRPSTNEPTSLPGGLGNDVWGSSMDSAWGAHPASRQAQQEQKPADDPFAAGGFFGTQPAVEPQRPIQQQAQTVPTVGTAQPAGAPPMPPLPQQGMSLAAIEAQQAAQKQAPPQQPGLMAPLPPANQQQQQQQGGPPPMPRAALPPLETLRMGPNGQICDAQGKPLTQEQLIALQELQMAMQQQQQHQQQQQRPQQQRPQGNAWGQPQQRQQQPRQGGRGQTPFAPHTGPSPPPGGQVHPPSMQYHPPRPGMRPIANVAGGQIGRGKLMTQDEVNWIMRQYHNHVSMLDPYIEDYYFTVMGLLAKDVGIRDRVRRSSHASGQVIRSFDKTLGTPQTHGIRTPRPVVMMDSTKSEHQDKAAKVQPGSTSHIPEKITFNAVRQAIEKGFDYLIDIEDANHVLMGGKPVDPERRSELNKKVSKAAAGLFATLGTYIPGKKDTADAKGKFEGDGFLSALLQVAKGRRLLVRALHLVSTDDVGSLLSAIVRLMPSLQHLEAEVRDQFTTHISESIFSEFNLHALSSMLSVYGTSATPMKALVDAPESMRLLAATLKKGNSLVKSTEEIKGVGKRTRGEWAQALIDLCARLVKDLTPILAVAKDKVDKGVLNTGSQFLAVLLPNVERAQQTELQQEFEKFFV